MTSRAASKTPDDQPFDFNLDAVQAEVALTPWRVNWRSRRWTFAHLDTFDIWPFMEDASGGGLDEMTKIMRTALGADEWAEFQKHPIQRFQMKALFDGYKKHCGVNDSGESVASSGS